jgi:hypothetical protein
MTEKKPFLGLDDAVLHLTILAFAQLTPYTNFYRELQLLSVLWGPPENHLLQDNGFL